MRKIMTCVLSVLVLFGSLAVALAEDVFVTKNGKKYHHQESIYIQGKEVTKLTKEEAEEKGYTPSKSYLKNQALKASGDK